MWQPPTRAEVRNQNLDEAGPIEYLIVEFLSGRVSADAFHQLLELAHDDRIRILDIEFVVRPVAGGPAALADPAEVLSQAGHDESSLAGASSGLLDDEDVRRVGGLISPGSLAAIVVYESSWVSAMAVQWSQTEAKLISMGQITMAELDTVLTSAPTT
jgi:hypothetical protein